LLDRSHVIASATQDISDSIVDSGNEYTARELPVIQEASKIPEASVVPFRACPKSERRVAPPEKGETYIRMEMHEQKG
jgi:hypothetical protein